MEGKTLIRKSLPIEITIATAAQLIGFVGKLQQSSSSTCWIQLIGNKVNLEHTKHSWDLSWVSLSSWARTLAIKSLLQMCFNLSLEVVCAGDSFRATETFYLTPASIFQQPWMLLISHNNSAQPTESYASYRSCPTHKNSCATENIIHMIHPSIQKAKYKNIFCIS